MLRGLSYLDKPGFLERRAAGKVVISTEERGYLPIIAMIFRQRVQILLNTNRNFRCLAMI